MMMLVVRNNHLTVVQHFFLLRSFQIYSPIGEQHHSAGQPKADRRRNKSVIWIYTKFAFVWMLFLIFEYSTGRINALFWWGEEK